MKLHWKKRLTNTNYNGEHAIAVGLRVGYWPCLHAPFIQTALGKWTVSLWWGDPENTET